MWPERRANTGGGHGRCRGKIARYRRTGTRQDRERGDRGRVLGLDIHLGDDVVRRQRWGPSRRSTDDDLDHRQGRSGDGPRNGRSDDRLARPWGPVGALRRLIRTGGARFSYEWNGRARGDRLRGTAIRPQFPRHSASGVSHLRDGQSALRADDPRRLRGASVARFLRLGSPGVRAGHRAQHPSWEQLRATSPRGRPTRGGRGPVMEEVCWTMRAEVWPGGEFLLEEEAL